MDEKETSPTATGTVSADPRNQSVGPGDATSEYKLSRNAMILQGAIAVAAFVLLGLGRIDFTGLLVLLGMVLGPSVVARGYSADRTALKRDVAKGAVELAKADVRAGDNS